ncbi:MAG: hypothetical protein Q9169_004506 [Polycauliona sp. 2 TL-2023]
MNWTGGSLSRSRKQNANLSIVQKRHFARARGKLLNARPSPQQIHQPIFHDILPRGSTTPAPSRPRERRNSQTTLESFQHLRPIVKKLKSLRPHCSPKRDGVELLHRGRPPSSGSTGLGEADEAAVKLITKRSRTPPVMDELEAKRRELLATHDWVGLDKMKPVKMAFANAEDRDLIGKRRLIKSNHGAFNCKPQQRRRPLPIGHGKFNMMTTARSTVSPGKISIHIGSSRRGSSLDRREDRSSNGGNHQRVPTSDEMLFDDEESFQGFMDTSNLSKNALHQSTNTSDDMLFGSTPDGANRLDFRPTTAARIYHATQPLPYQGHPSTPDTISSGGESALTFKAREVEEALGAHLAPGTQRNEGEQRQYPQNSTILKYPVLARLDPDRLPTVNHANLPELNFHGQRQSTPERTVAIPFDCNINHDRQTIESASSRSNGDAHDSNSAEANDSDVIESSGTDRVAGDIHDISHDHGQPDNRYNTAIFESHEDSFERCNVGQDQARPCHGITIGDVPRAATVCSSRSPDQANPRINAPVQSKAPFPLASEVEPLKPGPADKREALLRPTQEEDEVLWRRFVFGTDDPANDWTFEEEGEAVTHPPFIPKPERMTNTSSPLERNFNAANDSILNSSSPCTEIQTQPSLIVEASSSAANENLAMYTNISQSQLSSGPPATQHSVQAQAPTSPLQASDASPDPLTYCSSGPNIQPSVTFRKPSRYIGESHDSIMSVKLGGERGKRKRKRRAVDGDDDDGTYLEKEKRRRKKKGRRDWATSEIEEMSSEEAARDEIIDN